MLRRSFCGKNIEKQIYIYIYISRHQNARLSHNIRKPDKCQINANKQKEVYYEYILGED
jgi:hypothetical protein